MSARRGRGVAMSTVALLVVVAAFMASRSQDGPVRVTADLDGVVDPGPGAPSRPAGFAAPTDGVATRLLPVLVTPSTGLSDGQVVTISGSGFTPGVTLGAVLCSAGTTGGGGVAFCELAHYDNFSTSSEGTFVDDYVLRRFIETPAEGRVDCLESTDRCVLAVGNINDYDESGGSFISYAGAPDPPPPTIVVSPQDGLVDGQVVSVKGTALRAAPDGQLRQCPTGQVSDATCVRLAGMPDGPGVGGKLSVTVQVARYLASGERRVDCAEAPGCVLATTEYAGRMTIVAVGFSSAGEPSSAPPPTSAPPDPSMTAPAPPTPAPTEPPAPSTTAPSTPPGTSTDPSTTVPTTPPGTSPDPSTTVPTMPPGTSPDPSTTVPTPSPDPSTTVPTTPPGTSPDPSTTVPTPSPDPSTPAPSTTIAPTPPTSSEARTDG